MSKVDEVQELTQEMSAIDPHTVKAGLPRALVGFIPHGSNRALVLYWENIVNGGRSPALLRVASFLFIHKEARWYPNRTSSSVTIRPDQLLPLAETLLVLHDDEDGR